MGWPFVRRRMQTELGADWQSRFAEFHPGGFGGTSWGRCTKPAAMMVSCWLASCNIPDMAAAVEADLKQLRLLIALYGTL
jgi:hypothetical protein